MSIYKKDLYFIVAAFQLLLQGKKYAEIGEELQITGSRAKKLIGDAIKCMNDDLRKIWHTDQYYERAPHHMPYISSLYRDFWSERLFDWVATLFQNPEYTSKYYDDNWTFAAVLFQEGAK